MSASAAGPIRSGELSNGRRGPALNQQQGGILQQTAEFLEIFRAERAVDDTMIAAHRDRHAMADYHLIAIINHRDFCELAYSENETLRRINDGRETIDSHSTEILKRECATLKFFRFHPLVTGSMCQVLG